MPDGTEYFQVSPEFPHQNILNAVYIFGMVVDFLTIIHVVIILKLFSQITVVHKHLKIVSYSLWIMILLRSVTNISFAIRGMFQLNIFREGIPSIAYNLCRDSFNMGIFTLPAANVIERVVANVYATNYENWFSIIFVFALIILPWLIATWFSIHVIFFQQYLDVVYPYLMSNVLMFILFGTYFVLYFSERKKDSRQAYVSSLSERYQRAENKASYKTMFRFAISGTLIIIIAVGHNTILMNVLPYKFEYITLNDRRAFFRVSAINLLSVIILLLPSHFAYLNANMKTRYNAIFRSVWKRKPSLESSISNVHVQIKSLTGQNMVIPNETAYYFQALENQWGQKYCPER